MSKEYQQRIKKLFAYKEIPNSLAEINKFGDVKSLITNKELNTHYDKDGYEIVSIVINGKRKLQKIHRIVALTFIRKSNKQVNHIDLDKINNYYKNLEYVTDKQNKHHAIHNGVRIGGANPQKLTEEKVIDIRFLYSTNLYFQRELALEFGVSREMITYIVNNKTWKGIE